MYTYIQWLVGYLHNSNSAPMSCRGTCIRWSNCMHWRWSILWHTAPQCSFPMETFQWFSESSMRLHSTCLGRVFHPPFANNLRVDNCWGNLQDDVISNRCRFFLPNFLRRLQNRKIVGKLSRNKSCKSDKRHRIEKTTWSVQLQSINSPFQTQSSIHFFFH